MYRFALLWVLCSAAAQSSAVAQPVAASAGDVAPAGHGSTVSPATPSVPISFAEAIASAAQSPQVLQERAAAALLRDAQRTSPSLDANPTVTIAAGPRIAPSAERGFEGTLSISQSLSLTGAARLRRDALTAEATWLSAQADSELLRRRLAIAERWLSLREAEEQFELSVRAVGNESEFVTLVARLAVGGERTKADVAAGEARLAQALVQQLRAEGMVVDARAQLIAELGVTADEPLVTSGAAPEVALPTAAQQATMIAAAQTLPAVQSKKLAARSYALQALEERAARGMRLNVGVDASRDALGAYVVRGVVGIPLPLFDVAQRESASRRAASLRADAEAADAEVRARTMLSTVVHEVEHSEEVFAALRNRLVPAAERAVAMRDKQLQAHEGILLDVVEARRGFFEAHSQLIQARRDRAWARIRMATLFAAVRGDT
ncbi:MAG: TolC family protein [Kofleriaceae bacterium]|nr:TolC family protein [Kofleriaceae bacterium]